MAGALVSRRPAYVAVLAALALACGGLAVSGAMAGQTAPEAKIRSYSGDIAADSETGIAFNVVRKPGKPKRVNNFRAQIKLRCEELGEGTINIRLLGALVVDRDGGFRGVLEAVNAPFSRGVDILDGRARIRGKVRRLRARGTIQVRWLSPILKTRAAARGDEPLSNCYTGLVPWAAEFAPPS